MVKYLFLFAVIYGIYRFSLSSKKLGTKNFDELDKHEEEGFTDYEEVD